MSHIANSNKACCTTSTSSTGQYVDITRDAFNRFRVSSPYTLLDSQNVYRPSNKFFSNVAGTGNVSYLSTESAMLLSTGASGTAIRQTKLVYAYQPGKSLLTLFTFCIMSGTGTHRIGFFNPSDGMFFEYSNGAAYFVKRNQGSDTRVAQSSWSVDTLDGNGPSKIKLDTTKAQILWFDFEWLGIGTVRAGFVIDGQIIQCHTWNHANQVTGVYITSAILPARYEVSGSNASLKQICTSIVSEGGYEPNPLTFTVARGSTNADLVNLGTAGTIVPLISIRLKSTRLYGYVSLKQIDIINSSASDGIQWYLNYGSTLNTPSWTAHPYSDLIEYDITSTSMIDGQTIIGGYVNNSGLIAFDNKVEDFRLGQVDIGVPQVLTLAASGFANNLSVAARIVWFEI